MIGSVSAAEKAAILSHLSAQAALGIEDDDTVSSLRSVIDDAMQALNRATDALATADGPEDVQRVIDKLHSIGRDLAGADWE
jgi:predicted RNA polymerase sigma factor